MVTFLIIFLLASYHLLCFVFLITATNIEVEEGNLDEEEVNFKTYIVIFFISSIIFPILVGSKLFNKIDK